MVTTRQRSAAESRGVTAKFIGGRLCLDFVNTVGGREAGGRVLRDKLGGYDDLVTWARMAGILDGNSEAALHRASRGRPRAAGRVFRRAIELRESLYRVFAAALEGSAPRPADMAVLNRELADARHAERLAVVEGGFQWSPTKPRPVLETILRPIAHSAAELLTSPELRRVRQCSGSECRWLFLDTSRSRRRRWCDMRDCGNLAKVRRFRRRRKTTEA